MHTWRTHSAGLFLALIVLGGVVAPPLHQMQHGAAHQPAAVSIQPDRVPHSEADHTIRADAPGTATHSFYCLLCHTQLLAELPQQVVAPVPPPAAVRHGAAASSLVASSHLYRSLIRGPPMTA